MRLTSIGGVLLALAGLATVASCQRREGTAGANVILIVIDTLRADHLGSYGYDRPTSPRLDQFAAGAVRFSNARSSSSWTLPSVASILTGLAPAIHGAEQSDAVLSDDVDTMAQAYQSAGYETAAFSANPAFVTPRQGLARGFDRFEVLHGVTTGPRTAGAIPADASFSTWVLEASADVVTSAALEWIGARDVAKPFFLYLHYFDPHAAYTPPPEFARRLGVDPETPLAGNDQWNFLLAADSPPPAVLSTLVQLYDAEIAATDAAVGRLLDAVPAPLREATYVVVTSDHGEEFGEHGGLQHGRTLYDELIRVPLLIAGPGLPRGTSVEAAVSLTGLRATLQDLTRLSIEPAASLEPTFVPFIRREPSRPVPVFADLEKRFETDRQQHRRALIDGPWKLLLDPDRGSHLFHLGSDPGELSEHSEQSGDLATRRARMRSEILDRDAAAVVKRSVAPPRQMILDPAKREQLKALGYLQ